MLGRFFQRLEQRIGGLLVGAINMVDQKNAARSMQWLKLRALFQQSHLLDGDLAQRSSGGKVRKSGCVAKNSGSSLRLSDGHFSRSAMISAFASRLRSSCSILLAAPIIAAANRRAKVAFPTPSGHPTK